jgi:MoaA/NifB/PqqE/SkfB family radical SAM enzyme
MLTYEQVLGALRTLHGMGIRILIFEGGEPLLWRDGAYTMEHVVEEAKKCFFSVGMTTNGTLPLNIKTDVLWVSIDGLKETYDRIRATSYEKIIENIEHSSHPNLFANIAINNINFQEIPDLVKFLAKRVRGITIQFYYPFDGDMSLFLPFKERGEVLQKLIQLKREGYPVMDSYRCLKALARNEWKCEDWMIANVEPDGRINKGCYVRNRGDVKCELCGFAAHAEISFGYHWKLRPILVGMDIFRYRNLEDSIVAA